MEQNELLLAIGKMMDEKLEPIKSDIVGMKEDIVGIKGDIARIQEDVETLKEEAIITRSSVNLLLTWAEKQDRISHIGLYDIAK